MTDTPDLDIRRRVAAVLGWVDFATVGMDEELLMGVPPDAKNIYRVEVTPYEMSMDACLQDLAPVAREMGYRASWYQTDIEFGDIWCVRLIYHASGWMPTVNGEADTPAKAFCEAFLSLEVQE